MNSEDIITWCDETLPELYDEGMFDSEEISEDVWASVETALTLLEDLTEEDHEQLLDAAATWFQTNHDLILEAIEPLPQKQITAMTTKPQTTQHSADWYNERRNRLTASEFAQILDGRRSALLRQKISQIPGDRVGMSAPIGICQEDGEMNATTWGHRFEPVTRRIYELEVAGVGTVCDTLGRFTHQSTQWLSASPDGVVLKGKRTGRLVEIKSPKTRQPGEFVPQEYYIQMQIQMEVCDLDVVDFIEAQFAQRPVAAFTANEADQEACKKAAWKGRIEVRGYLEDSSTWSYRYTDPVEDLEDAVFVDLKTTEYLPLLESSVWWLTGFYPRTVLRNQAWWDTIGWPNAQLFWAEVQSLRDQHITSPPLSAQAGDLDKIEHISSSSGWLGSR
jgi:hypothetical protein